ncbi:hypothetical protein CN163_32215 [Sinorhizobium meliloti]|nr:hypothetical protein CN163_32215 [Sinorhizobium meliloti]
MVTTTSAATATYSAFRFIHGFLDEFRSVARFILAETCRGLSRGDRTLAIFQLPATSQRRTASNIASLQDPNNYDGLTNVVFIVQGRIAA